MQEDLQVRDTSLPYPEVRAAIAAMPDGACRAQAALMIDALDAYRQQQPRLYASGGPLAFALVGATARQCATGVNGFAVTSLAAPHFAYRLLTLSIDGEHPPAAPPSTDTTTLLELSLAASEPERAAALAPAFDLTDLPRELAARRALAEAHARTEDDPALRSALTSAHEQLTALGMIADAFQAATLLDGHLARTRRHADRPAFLGTFIAWCDQVSGSDPILRATVRNRLAVALDMSGRHDEAIGVNRVTAAEFEHALGPLHPFARRSRTNIGVILGRQGHAEEALDALQMAITLHEQAQDDPSGWAVALEASAAQLTSLGRFDEAESNCRKAIELRSTRLPADHPDTRRGQRCLDQAAQARTTAAP